MKNFWNYKSDWFQQNILSFFWLRLHQLLLFLRPCVYPICYEWHKHPLMILSRRSSKQMMFASCHTRMTTLANLLQMERRPDFQSHYIGRRSLSPTTTFRLSKIQIQCLTFSVLMISPPLTRISCTKLYKTAWLVGLFIWNVLGSLRYNSLHFSQANVLEKSCE